MLDSGTFLADNHDVFSLEEGEQDETSLTTIETDTGDAPAPEATSQMNAIPSP